MTNTHDYQKPTNEALKKMKRHEILRIAEQLGYNEKFPEPTNLGNDLVHALKMLDSLKKGSEHGTAVIALGTVANSYSYIFAEFLSELKALGHEDLAEGILVRLIGSERNIKTEKQQPYPY